MEEHIQEFRKYWDENYSFISLDLEDYEIEDFIRREYFNIPIACSTASDYLLSQGLADVQE